MVGRRSLQWGPKHVRPGDLRLHLETHVSAATIDMRTDAHCRREDRTEMAVRVEHEFAAHPHADARPGVHSFSRAWVAAARCLRRRPVPGRHLPRRRLRQALLVGRWSIRHVAVPALLTAVLLGRRLLAAGLVPPLLRDVGARRVLPRGRGAVAGLAAGAGRFSLFPGSRPRGSSRSSRCCFSIALIGSARAIAHRVRDILVLAHPRRIAVVGHPSRLEFAEDAMRSLPNARVFRLSVPNIDAVGALSPEARRVATVVPPRRRVGLRHAGVHRDPRALADAAGARAAQRGRHHDRLRAAAHSRPRLRPRTWSRSGSRR